MTRAACLAVAALLGGGAAVAAQDARHAVGVFAGPMLDAPWEDVFLQPWTLEVERAGLVGVAASTRLWRPAPWLDVELEGQFVAHFGDQDHVEANGPIVTARWTAPPWSRWIDSSIAYGLGVSYASARPALEIENQGDTERLLAYWMIEVDAALPEDGWRAFWRLHHRSTAFGTFGDEGGSNALVLGLRRAF